MFTSLGSFFDIDGLMPHGMCLLWRPDIMWTQIAADTFIAAAYFSIPAALVYFARHRRNFPNVRVLYLFGAFIVWCGFTHLASILTFWVPAYGLEAAVKVVTAGVSVTTAIMLWPLMPKVLGIPSIGELQAKNRQLEREIADRISAERRLQELTVSLEQRVEQRTRELTEVNAHLEMEIERRRQSEAELLKAFLIADTANDAKTAFLAGMSHELRSPLTAILGFAEMLEQVVPEGLSPRQRDYLKDIRTSAGVLLDLIERLLDMSMLESGRTDIRPEPIDIAVCLDKARTILAPLARQFDVALSIDGPGPDGGPVFADPTRLSQIIVNLGSNAIKYNRRGGRAEISVRLTPEGDLMVRVTDTGVGIPDRFKPQVFQSFNRLNQDASGIPGAGLGLALSRHLAHAMGGDLTFESREGWGSTFFLTLQQARA
ncbi:MAG: sensor histidine kinase [Rhodospirillaceae bacterium]